MGMVVASHGRKKGKAVPEMNVTPLVDVVLVVLIIFMVVMPAMQRFFWVHVPKPATTETPPAEQAAPIVVSVNAAGEVRINQDIIPDESFPARLRRMLVARGDRKIYFDAANAAPFERAVAAMDMARGAGAAHIAVMTTHLD